jgi:Zn-dependent peptidase ImmA (M78 family)/transcriptional regulator with XRE-family HTH domain
MASNTSPARLFDAARLRLARESRGLLKKDLAALVEISPASITQYETGRSRPSPSTMARLALALSFPPGFFEAGRPMTQAESAGAHFRSLRSTRLLERQQALAHAELFWEIAQAVESRVRYPDPTVPELPAGTSPSDAARQVRTEWNLQAGPAPSIVKLLEAHGILVTRLVTGLDRVDAFSCWFTRRPVVVLGADKADTARSRFDAAHELGHLVLHHDREDPNPVVENEAHGFAAEFLMPADEIRPLLPRRADWQSFMVLKRTWGVSIAALLFRARKLGVMTDATYRRAMATMSKEGWRKNEPGELPVPESPTLLGRALELLEPTGFGVDELAKQLSLPSDILDSIVRESSDVRPRLSVLPQPSTELSHVD